MREIKAKDIIWQVASDKYVQRINEKRDMRREQWEQLREAPWPLHSRRSSWGRCWALQQPGFRGSRLLSCPLLSSTRSATGITWVCMLTSAPRTPVGRPSVIPSHLIRPLSALGKATHTLLLEDFPLRFYLYSLELSFCSGPPSSTLTI